MTIKFDVLNRFSGAVQFTAEIDCKADTPQSWKLRLAVLWGVEHRANLSRADLSRADLSGANLSRADLSWADLSWANLSRANLSWANLSWANLSRANLSSANLSGADLSGADLSWFIQGPTRSDGYEFKLTKFKDESVMVRAGCRNFTMKEARKHWNDTRKGTLLGNETFAILDCLEAMATARGLDLNAKPEKET